ncbi:oxidoreductase (plasmid) [Paracoccus liaowanqingii]|uniref:Oxidoreductase n=1 Tax=Paracoccus liaowanqingii TaxID=2560053 RepID=A0A4Y5SUN9_9RHOB|nr:molybdopterin-dependent oxidoreductase [Paracoccus liaowanqingii]QDA36515.1 oxidoreductase [Paracoccus liaowanqingii]
MRVFRVCCLVIAVSWAGGVAYSEDIPLPEGDIILKVSGAIENTNLGDTVQFDREMLEKIGMVDLVTATPWHDGRISFSGVPLGNLLDFVGSQGETIVAVALNDYEVEIPVSDAFDTGVILALEMNGEVMSVRDKGPVFVIYPYDSSEKLNSQTYFSRSAWQVAHLIIR